MTMQVVSEAREGQRIGDECGAVAAVNRCLRLCGEEGLRWYVSTYYSTHQLLTWLDSYDEETIVAAAACLGTVGDGSLSERLAQLLHHESERVVAASESALWNIWFRAGSRLSRRRIGDAVVLMQQERFSVSRRLLDEIISDEPTYAEAFNQRAIARYLTDDFCGSIADCRRVLALNPYHFGATAGMGHCFANLGRYGDALKCYYAALSIHPRMEGIRESTRQIRSLQATGRLSDPTLCLSPSA